MTAEFDSSGFSAVDKFFGNGTDKAAGHEKLTGTSSTAGSRGKRRGGVGESLKSNEQATKSLSSDILAKKILNVGRKRGRDNSNDDDEYEYEGDGVDDHGVHDADEVDGGRTSIVEKPKAIASKKTGGKDKDSKPKKKLGKKERERQKLAAKNEVLDADANQEHNSAIPETTASNKEKEHDGIKHAGSTERPSTKKKRRKVRSKQKNIYKDKRSVDEKPVHLIPGNSNFRGRPMTEATREKLNLPAPPPRNKHRNKFNNKDTGDTSSLFTIDRNPDSSGDDVGVTLAIDEFMSNADEGDVEKGASLNESKDSGAKEKKKSSKKKKNRFKNL